MKAERKQHIAFILQQLQVNALALRMIHMAHGVDAAVHADDFIGESMQEEFTSLGEALAAVDEAINTLESAGL